MKLSHTELQELVLGAARAEREAGGTVFYRFTEREEEVYRQVNSSQHLRTQSSSGIRLELETDSRTLTLAVSLSEGSSRFFYSFDLFVDGHLTDTLSNFDPAALPKNYATEKLSLADAEKTFSLGEGTKQVCLYLPFSVKTVIRELSLDDGATVRPIKPSRRLLCYGDSITQGFDVLYPSNKYTTRLARYLGAEELNKGIGGAVFHPPIIDAAEELRADLITVAYGSNDWNRLSEAEFTERCDGFLSALRARYAEPEILVITPIWRKDADEGRPMGPFSRAGEIIAACAARHRDMRVIDGTDLVTHDESLFGDGRLHPNDEGFAEYFENLVKKAAL